MKPSDTDGYYLGAGLALGAGLGLMLGNLALGIALGVAIGAALDYRRRNKDASGPKPGSDDRGRA